VLQVQTALMARLQRLLLAQSQQEQQVLLLQ
jgi:hypothetical protein